MGSPQQMTVLSVGHGVRLQGGFVGRSEEGTESLASPCGAPL